jgi:dTDP-4-amino-4,6-dideoxygalactose transaminase
VNAAIGLAQIRQYPALLKRRKQIFEQYQHSFSAYDWAIIPPQYSASKESSCHLYALRIKNITEQQRDDIIDQIAEEEVAVNVHYLPMPMLSFFKNQGYNIDDYPQAYKNYAHEISLPIYPQLTDEEVDFVIKTVVAAYEKVMKQK